MKAVHSHSPRRSALALPSILHLEWPEIHAMKTPRMIAGFDEGRIAQLAVRLITQWLSEDLGHQFIEDPARQKNSLALEAFQDKLNYAFPHHGAFIGLIGFGRKRRSHRADRSAIPELVTPAARDWELPELFETLSDIKPIHLTLHGLARACLNLDTNRANVMLDDVPGCIELVSMGRLARAAQAQRARSAMPTRWSETRAWYGLGVPTSSPVNIVEQLRNEITARLNPSVTTLPHVVGSMRACRSLPGRSLTHQRG